MSENSPPEPGSNLPAAYSPQRALTQPLLGRGTASPMYEEQGVPWARYIDAIRRQLWLVVLVSGLGIAAGFYVAKSMRPSYEAVATIFITASGPQSTTGVIGGDPLIRSASSYDQLIKSYAVLDPVVRDLGLYVSRSAKDSALFRSFAPPDSAVFRPGRFHLVVDSLGRSYTLTTLKSQRPPERGAVGDSIGRALGFFWAPSDSLLTPNRVVDFSVTTVEAASASLIGNLTTGLPEQGQILTLRLSGSDPQRAAATLNAWARQFVSTAFEYKKGGLTTNRKNLAAQLGAVDSQLRRQEADVRDFRERHPTLQVDNASTASSAVATTYVQLQGQLDSIQLVRRQLDSIVSIVPAGRIDPDRYYAVPAALAQSPLLKKNVDLAIALRDSIARMTRNGLTAGNRAVIPLQVEYDTLVTISLPAVTKEIVAQMARTEQSLSRRIRTDSASLHSIPQLALDFQRLTTRVAASQATFNSLQARFETVKLAEDETTSDMRVLQDALAPQSPTSNKAPRLFLMAVMASIGAGLALALVRDRFDRRFRYPEQAAVDLGLTIVGTVPSLSFTRRGELSVSAMFQVVESFRVLRLAVRHQFAPNQPVVMCVSSPGPSEGKSLVSSNLAVAFANAGQKTLLIDGDVRRGVVHSTFSLARRPGLIDYLGNNASADAIVQSTATHNLSVVTSGSHSRRAPELLVSGRMAKLVAEMRERFEVVIIDSAPFAAGMDAYALGAAAGAMLVVLRRGHTDRKLAAAKLEILDRLPVSILGSVVNGISGSASYRYYEYDAGYAIDDERKEETDFADPGANAGPVKLAGKK